MNPIEAGQFAARVGSRVLSRMLDRVHPQEASPWSEKLFWGSHGIWFGLLVAGIALAWKQNPSLGLVLGVAMLGNMVIAGFVGAAIRLFLRRIGVDPQSSQQRW